MTDSRTSRSEPCSNHPNEPQLGYLAACEDADRRIKRRKQQWKCGRCGRWVWGEFMVNMDGAISEGWYKRVCREADRKGKR